VAAFCTKCGAGLTPGVQFCTACGAPVGPAAAAAASYGQQPAYRQPAPSQPVYGQPAYGQPAYGQPVYGQPAGAAPIPPPANTNVVKIILIVVGALIGVSLLSVLVFMFAMSRIFHVNRHGGVTINTPNGAITTGSNSSVSESDLGVPFYPRATRREDGMQINTGNGSLVTVILSTPDPVSSVVDFYKSKLGDNVSVIRSDTGAVISAGDQNKQGVIITVGTDTNDGSTKIAIMRTKSK